MDPKSMCIVGKGGKSLVEYFESRGGPEAYLGTTFPGFPNYFSILGSCAIDMIQTVLMFTKLQALMWHPAMHLLYSPRSSK